MSLPTPRQLLTTLLTTLQAESQSALSASTPTPGPSTTTSPTSTTNPLKSLPEPAKDLLLTLSHLIPTFIPALDLLDHRRVRRCRPSPHSRRFAYFVASGPGPGSGSVVVVRPAAWWCACRAFASAAFGSGESGDGGGGGGGGGGVEEGHDGGWGGRMLGDGDVPVCMHLVACVLVEECPSLFAGFVEEVEVDLERWVEIELEGRWGGGG